MTTTSCLQGFSCLNKGEFSDGVEEGKRSIISLLQYYRHAVSLFDLECHTYVKKIKDNRDE